MRRPWTHLLIHHSAAHDGSGLDWLQIRAHHVNTNGWRDIGYHFVVEKIGDTYVAITGRPINEEGAHCPGMNKVALGVCLVGNFEAAEPPQAQVDAAVRLITGLCDQFGIPPGNIHPHRDHKATVCPGRVPIERIRAAVAMLLSE